MNDSEKSQPTTTSLTKRFIALAVAALGVALAAGGIYVGENDDAPGAALLGILLMMAAFVFATKLVLRRPHSKKEKPE